MYSYDRKVLLMKLTYDVERGKFSPLWTANNTGPWQEVWPSDLTTGGSLEAISAEFWEWLPEL